VQCDCVKRNSGLSFIALTFYQVVGIRLRDEVVTGRSIIVFFSMNCTAAVFFVESYNVVTGFRGGLHQQSKP